MSSGKHEFDYIFAGSGCAGLSLITRMLSNQHLASKKILIIDKDLKDQNDRTWCFWENTPGFFEPIVHHRWNMLGFYGQDTSRKLEISPYAYKMIRSVDFYRHCQQIIAGHDNVQMLTGDVASVTNTEDGVVAMVNGRRYTGRFCFNSTLTGLNIDETRHIFLRQHFKGWLIHTGAKVFDPRIATLMDFRVPQSGGTSFFYVLPLSEDRALVEYTLFTKDLLTPERYDDSLRRYIDQRITSQPYEIVEEEYGVIPMTTYPFLLRNGNIFNIGTAGGQTKGSTGYTFQFIQRHSEKIVNALVQTGHPPLNRSAEPRRFSLYDAVMLRVLSDEKHRGAELFTKIFTGGDPISVLRFLDNVSNPGEEIAIMNRLPKRLFGKAAAQELLSRIVHPR